MNNRVSITECNLHPGEWLVEYINHADEGQIAMARFSGLSAERHARDFYELIKIKYFQW